jgi:hypothetical protein
MPITFWRLSTWDAFHSLMQEIAAPPQQRENKLPFCEMRRGALLLLPSSITGVKSSGFENAGDS